MRFARLRGAHFDLPSLSVDRIASDLRLSEKGAERGRDNEPPSASAAFDDIES